MTASPWKRALLIVAVIGTIGCDRVTKRMALVALADAPQRSYLSDTIRLAYAENTGGFLSLGADLPERTRTLVFTVGTGLMILGLIPFAYGLRKETWPLFALVLFMAGSVSNWIDRAAAGHVVDFLNVGIGPLRTGIFNVADVAIMAGEAIFVLTWIRKPSRASAPLA